jgi:hypothetical protein
MSLSVRSPRTWVQAIRYGRDLFVYDHDFKNVEIDADLTGTLVGLPEQWRFVGTLSHSGIAPHCIIDSGDNVLSWTETQEWCALLGFESPPEASSGYSRPIENFPLASHVRRTSFFRP